MLQLVYISSPSRTVAIDIASILRTSRRNNARDGITGLLYFDGNRFLQVLEGPEAAVEAAYERIRPDVRHRAPVVLSRREVDAREFGEWDMAHRESQADAADFLGRIEVLTRNASPSVRATFDGLARVQRAA